MDTQIDNLDAHIDDWGLFPFLDDDKIRKAFRQAVHATNKLLAEEMSRKGSVWACMKQLSKANIVRGWLIGHVNEAVLGDDTIKPGDKNNIEYLEFPSGDLVHFKKIRDPQIAPSESKTMREARLESLQESVFDDEEDDSQLCLPSFEDMGQSEKKAQPTPLSKLKPTLAGYVCVDSQITQLYFMKVDYTNERVLGYVQLDISEIAKVQTPVVASKQRPRPAFSPRVAHEQSIEEESTA